MPTIWCVGSVPERMPRSWPPPCICASIRTLRLAPDVERADALRTVGLVRRERHQVDLELRQVERDLAGRLRCVDVEDDAARAADLADRREILDHADFVVDRHHRHQDRVGPQRRRQRIRIDEPVRQHVEIRRLETLALELAHRVERGLVLGLHRDDVLALVLVEMRGALQREVDRFRRSRRPDDFLRVAVHERERPPRAPLRPLSRRPIRTRASATPDCRNARSDTGSSSARRADRPASSPSNRDRLESS